LELQFPRQPNGTNNTDTENLTFARCVLQAHPIDISNLAGKVTDDNTENNRNAAYRDHYDDRAACPPMISSCHLLLLLEVSVVDAAFAILGEQVS
jgi:hypothetical protein